MSTTTDNTTANGAASAPAPATKENTYTFVPSDDAQESERLDGLHTAIFEYFGRELHPAGLAHERPATILEIGSGSGAWALHAARLFPHAHITAVDLHPPPRALPANVTFVAHDLTRPFPFAPGAFGVVHARLVFLHVPRGADALARAAALVAPGGLLLLEEPDNASIGAGAGPPGPGMARYLESIDRVMHARGADPSFGREAARVVAATKMFAEVTDRIVNIPISGRTDDAKLKAFGLMWRDTVIRIARDLAGRLPEVYTQDVVQGAIDEMLDPAGDVNIDIHFVWARKKRV